MNKTYGFSSGGTSMFRSTNDVAKNKISTMYKRPSIRKQMSVDYDRTRQKIVNLEAPRTSRLVHQPNSTICDRMTDEPTANPKPDERFKFRVFLNQSINDDVTNADHAEPADEIRMPKGENAPTKFLNKPAINTIQEESSKRSAENKRALYRASRENAFVPQNRLVRAMSAPLRHSIDTETNPWLARRRSKSKRIEVEQPLYFESTNRSTNKDERTRTRSKLSLKPNNELGNCDIVTLVSLLSPNASDSEKEDTTQTKVEPKVVTSPAARRIEKSVSFQENEISSDVMQNELPTMIRRASIAPLAAKIRSNRPPTAPPGSIFLKQKETRAIEPAPIERRSVPKFSDESFPEYVRTEKEKECWILYKKIADKGIIITYETILRGMLPPSEVRVIESKQRDYIERQATLELEK